MSQRAASDRNPQRQRPARAAQAATAVVLAVLMGACQSPAPEHPDGGTATASEHIGEVADGLAAPWSMDLLGDGHLLVSERDSGRILDVAPDGTKQVVGTVPGVVHQGEGGLLGLATGLEMCMGHPTPDPATGCLAIYAYLTTAGDNRIVRMPLLGLAGSRSLGPAAEVLTGIPKGSNHNGGRIKFGPDGMLYIGTGDAGNRNNAQDPASLGGKILRIARDGSIPQGNPFPDSPVWTVGHRNVQGLAWDESGRMFASEFGQNTWDELNRIQAGKNYGWPVVEGKGADPQFTNPVLTWPTSEASPSGIAIAGTTLYMASLRGERLWEVRLDGAPTARARLTGQLGRLGRLRDVTLTTDGRLFVLTNNTDGRGDPKPGDDRIVEIRR